MNPSERRSIRIRGKLLSPGGSHGLSAFDDRADSARWVLQCKLE